MNFEVPEFVSKGNSKATEYDRFIPQRQPDCGLGSNFENKDYIFSEKSLSCTHTAYEAGCSNFSNSNNNSNVVNQTRENQGVDID